MRSSMRPLMRRGAVSATAGATALTGVLAVLGAAPADADVVTDYGFAGTAYGTRANAEQPGLSSGRTAYASLGCTRVAGTGTVREMADGESPGDAPELG